MGCDVTLLRYNFNYHKESQPQKQKFTMVSDVLRGMTQTGELSITDGYPSGIMYTIDPTSIMSSSSCSLTVIYINSNGLPPSTVGASGRIHKCDEVVWFLM